MGPIDMGALIILVLLGLRVAFSGLVAEVSAMASLLGGALAAFLFGGLVGSLLEQWTGPGPFSQVLGSIIVFALVFLLVLLLKSSLNAILEGLNLQGLNHGLGLILGLVEGILVVAVLAFFLDIQTAFPLGDTLRQSWTWKLLSPFFPYALEFVQGEVGV